MHRYYMSLILLILMTPIQGGMVPAGDVQEVRIESELNAPERLHSENDEHQGLAFDGGDMLFLTCLCWEFSNIVG